MPNQPNKLEFRIPKNRPLTFQEMDDRSRYPNEWVLDFPYKVGMIVLHDDSLAPIPGAQLTNPTNGVLSHWRATQDHTSEYIFGIPDTSNCPGSLNSPWERVSGKSRGVTVDSEFVSGAQQTINIGEVLDIPLNFEYNLFTFNLDGTAIIDGDLNII